jgi:hypothetical protein
MARANDQDITVFGQDDPPMLCVGRIVGGDEI